METKEIIKQVRRIEIVTSRMVNDVMAGEYHSVFKGRGMEFDEVREYTPGDDIRTIDWNVTARAGSPHVKRYVEERELTVMLMVDASMSLEYGAADHMKSEIALRLCAILAFSAIKNNDRVGLILFTDTVEKYIPPQKGRKHVLRLIRELLCFRAQNKGTHIRGALEYLAKVTTRRAVTFLISDFHDTGYRESLSIASRRHDLVAVKIDDPTETEEMPGVGLVEFQDAETGEMVLVDTSHRGARAPVAQSARDADAEMIKMFRSLKTDFVPIRTGENYIEPLVSFFRQRAKRY